MLSGLWSSNLTYLFIMPLSLLNWYFYTLDSFFGNGWSSAVLVKFYVSLGPLNLFTNWLYDLLTFLYPYYYFFAGDRLLFKLLAKKLLLTLESPSCLLECSISPNIFIIVSFWVFLGLFWLLSILYWPYWFVEITLSIEF